MAEIYIAGWNNSYSLGLGNNTQQNTHVQVPGDWIVYRHSPNAQFSLGIKSDGTLWGVGDNAYNQLGLPSASYTTLTQIGSATDWIDVAPGSGHALALKSDGTIWATGLNSEGQCGTGGTSHVSVFTQISITGVFVEIHARGSFSFAIKNDGTVYSWGANNGGVLGLNSGSSYFTTPQLITGLPAACESLALGGNFALAVTSEGKLYSWGDGYFGALGLGDNSNRLAPVQVGSATDWASVSCNSLASFAIKTNGAAYSCGDGSDYGTAHGDTTNRNTFAQIGSDTDWVKAAACYQSVLLQKSSGAVYVAGNTTRGHLGTGSTTTVTALTALAGLPGASITVTGAEYASVFSLPIVPPAKATAPTRLTVVNPSGKATAPTRLTMVASGKATAPTRLAVIDATSAVRWSARCLIDGVDVSARIAAESSVSVTAEEGAARVASITLVPSTGAVDPLDYVGMSIVIDYVSIVGATSIARRVFTGRVDTPVYDPATTLLTLRCVDDLQNRVAAMHRTALDTLIGGRYSTAVQGKIDDNWDYAQARLTTVAASLDAAPNAALRVTPWEIASTWKTYTESNLLYARARLVLPQRSTMVNSVQIEYEYRYPRLRQRYASLGWSGTLIDMAPAGYQYPTQQDILGAAGGSGWTVTTAIFTNPPAAIPHSSGGFIYPDDSAVDMAILFMTQRHAQTVTEKYVITVQAPESIDQNGTLPHAMRGALSSTFDGLAWESALDVAPLMPTGGEQDYGGDGATRADSDHAIDTLLDQARVKILSTHRAARVANAVLCDPDVDLDKRIAINTDAMQAAGKVASVRHVLDLARGSAITEFELAVFGAGGAGIITPDTLAPPDPPDEAEATQDWPAGIPPLFVNTYGITAYTDDLMGLLVNPPESIFVEDIPPDNTSASYPNPSYTAGTYPVQGFRVKMPGVDDADRNPVEKNKTASYSIIVPSDTLSFTVP